MTDLVNKVYSSLLLDLFEGLELHAKQDGSETACKILKVIGSGNTKLYEVGWIGQDNAVISTSVLKADDLIRKKAPASRNTLKNFIRDSTSQNCPWILHANLAKKYRISTEPPGDMMVTVFFSFPLFSSVLYDSKSSMAHRMVKVCTKGGKGLRMEPQKMLKKS